MGIIYSCFWLYLSGRQSTYGSPDWLSTDAAQVQGTPSDTESLSLMSDINNCPPKLADVFL